MMKIGTILLLSSTITVSAQVKSANIPQVKSSCTYNGQTVGHAQFLDGETHTCQCNDGNWVNCNEKQIATTIRTPTRPLFTFGDIYEDEDDYEEEYYDYYYEDDNYYGIDDDNYLSKVNIGTGVKAPFRDDVAKANIGSEEYIMSAHKVIAADQRIVNFYLSVDAKSQSIDTPSVVARLKNGKKTADTVLMGTSVNGGRITREKPLTLSVYFRCVKPGIVPVVVSIPLLPAMNGVVSFWFYKVCGQEEYDVRDWDKTARTVKNQSSHKSIIQKETSSSF